MRIIQKQRLQQSVKIQLLFPASTVESEWYHALSPSESRGLVAIGFFSQQTIGASFHINLPVFSTFDRENLDFENISLKKWNEDLLFLAGTTARVYYDSQIKNISSTHSEGGKCLVFMLIARLSKFVEEVCLLPKHSQSTSRRKCVARILAEGKYTIWTSSCTFY